MKRYMVIGVYEDDFQGYEAIFEAESAKEAASAAVKFTEEQGDGGLIVAAVLEGDLEAVRVVL